MFTTKGWVSLQMHINGLSIQFGSVYQDNLREKTIVIVPYCLNKNHLVNVWLVSNLLAICSDRYDLSTIIITVYNAHYKRLLSEFDRPPIESLRNMEYGMDLLKEALVLNNSHCRVLILLYGDINHAFLYINQTGIGKEIDGSVMANV